MEYQAKKKVVPFLKLEAPKVDTGEQYSQCIEYLNLIMTAQDKKTIKNKKGDPDFSGTSLWLVRAGNVGQDEHIALEKKVVGIGYGGLKGLEEITDNAYSKKGLLIYIRTPLLVQTEWFLKYGTLYTI